MVTPVINQPDQVRHALLSTKSFVIVDIESTGLTRHDDLVSVGVLVDGVPYILFVYTRYIPVISQQALQHALAPLATRDDLAVVGHNIGFDLGFLARAGVNVRCAVHDTELLLRLCDSDRGKNKDIISARIDRLAAPGAPELLNYRLKDTVPQLLGLGMVSYDETTPMETLPYHEHVLYLSSDLLGTATLYEHLVGRMTPGQWAYYAGYVAPITPILVGMTETGIRLDTQFVNTQVARLQRLMAQLSDEHKHTYGVPLGMTQAGMCEWLFSKLGLQPESYKKLSARERALGRPHVPSLDSEHIKLLAHTYSGNSRVAGSLTLIQNYRRATTIMVGVKKLLPYCSPRDGRIHTRLRDTQSTGRISSTKPNLQGLTKAGKGKVAGVEVISRNALVATDGYVFVDFDIRQADIRCLAHCVSAFPCKAETYLKRLQRARQEALKQDIGAYLDRLDDRRNKGYKSKHPVRVPNFDPTLPCALSEVLRTDPDPSDPNSSDPYYGVAARITGTPVREVVKPVRDTFKTVTLGMVNSITPTGLARQLGYGDDTEAVLKAKGHMEQFFAVYPQVKLYTETLRWHVAITGETTTWAGRTRVCTAHKWMVTLPRVELLCSFRKGSEWLWIDCVPLRPSRHCITIWIKRIWDATFRSPNYGRLVYEDTKGPLCTYPYHILNDNLLLYWMPARNLSWRSIRQVRTDSEEAQYFGFDATARSLVNSIYQGGTTDISRVGILRGQPLCTQYGARPLLQIHDELLFECPTESATEFATKMKATLEQPPHDEFRIPIRVDAKTGSKFGSLKSLRTAN
jgi:DNA polymerase I-like protein with 3'-5' exonuclease and polymerase domains